MKIWFKIVSIVVLVVAFVAMLVFPVYKTMQGFSLAVEISFIAAIIAAILLLIYASVRDDHSVKPKLAKWIMVIVILTMIALFVTFLFDSNVYGRTSSAWWKISVTTSEPVTNSTVTPEPATNSAPAPTETPTLAVVSNDDYKMGWKAGETKPLLPGHVGAGDIRVDKLADYFDEGGINEATLVLNLSSHQYSVFSEFGAGEYLFSDKNYSINDMISAEFIDGGDPDAQTVRLVIITDIGVSQTWYDSDFQVIRSETKDF